MGVKELLSDMDSSSEAGAKKKHTTGVSHIDKGERIPVLAPDGEPLMPTKPARARKWIESGKAEPFQNKLNHFGVQLKEEPSGRAKQDVVAALDPGSKFSGIAVASKEAVLCGFNLELPQKVSKRMDKRKERRRNRRYRKTRRRPKRFDNRTGHWLAPSIKARKQLELKVIKELSKIYPISKIAVEDVSYDHHTKKDGGYFSQVEVGKNWLISKLKEIAPVKLFKGWQTSRERKELGLEKSSNKDERTPRPHVHDAIALASLVLGDISLTSFRFDVVTRPKYSRRKLHLEQPSKGGIRKKYGGSTTPFKYRKGDYVEARQGNKTVRGWVSGYTKNLISVSDFNWNRLGQFAKSKTRLISRNSGLMSKSKEVKSRHLLPHVIND